MVELVTRPPTGKVAYPLVLVEHEEKAGGSYALAQFAASPHVGRTFILDTGDGTADEYATLGPYEILVHDGTWPSIIGQIEAATKVPATDGKPNVVGIDHGSAIWQTLKVWTDNRARNSRKGQAALAEDPDAEIDAPMNLWNDSKARWGRMIHLLKNFDGIGVLLAHGQEVTKVENGTPTRDSVWTIEAEKNTEGAVSAIVKILRDPRRATLVGVRSLHAPDLPVGGLVLPDQGMLDHVVFEVLGAGGFASSEAVATTAGMPTPIAKASVLDRITRAYPDNLTDDEKRAEAKRLWVEYGLPSEVEEVPAEKVQALLLDIADGKTQEPPPDGDPVPGRGGPEPQPPDTDGEAHEPTTPPQEPQDGPGGDAARETPGNQEAATEGEVTLLGESYSEADARHWLDDARRPALVQVAKVEKILATGQTEAIRARLFEHFHLHDWVEAAAEKVAEAFEGAEEVELIDVPEGWVEGRCLCGEPLTYKPGEQKATIRHLDPTLDANHPAEEPF